MQGPKAGGGRPAEMFRLVLKRPASKCLVLDPPRGASRSAVPLCKGDITYIQRTSDGFLLGGPSILPSTQWGNRAWHGCARLREHWDSFWIRSSFAFRNRPCRS